jgi:hypothetical protein
VSKTTKKLSKKLSKKKLHRAIESAMRLEMDRPMSARDRILAATGMAEAGATAIDLGATPLEVQSIYSLALLHSNLAIANTLIDLCDVLGTALLNEPADNEDELDSELIQDAATGEPEPLHDCV